MINTYYGGNRNFNKKKNNRFRKMFFGISVELSNVLINNFRDNSKIDNILRKVYDDKLFFKILKRLYNHVIFSYSESISVEEFLEWNQTLPIEILFENYVIKEKAVFLILVLGEAITSTSFCTFFLQTTMKHYAFLIESLILDIDIEYNNNNREIQIQKILQEIFFSISYRNYLIKSEIYTDQIENFILKLTGGFHTTYSKSWPKKIKLLFEKENKDALEYILLFIVKHGNRDYWKEKTVKYLFP